MNDLIQKPLTLRTLTFIAAATFLCYEMILQVALAVVTEPLMASAGLNASHLGWLSSCYFLSYTVMQIPAGLMFDRFSCRNVMFYSAICCALGSLLFAYFTHNTFLIYLARFLIGAGSAFPFVGLLVVASNCFREEQFPMFVGITQILAASGALLGSAPLAHIVQKLGWLVAMQYTAILGVICVAAIFIGLHMLRQAPIRNNHKSNIMADIKSITAKKETWKIAAYALTNWGPMIILSSLWGEPFLVEKLGISTQEAAKIIEFLWIGLSLGSFALGAIATTHAKQKIYMIITALIGVSASLIFIYAGLSSINYYLLVSTLIGIASAGQILSFSMVKSINSSDLVGTAVGFNNMSVVAGGLILQPIVGEMMQIFWDKALINGTPHYSLTTFQISLVIVPICYLLSFIIAFFFKDINKA